MHYPLPVPTIEEIKGFKEIYLRECGVELSDADAEKTATQMLHLFCLGTYGLPRHNREQDTAKSHDAAS